MIGQMVNVKNTCDFRFLACLCSKMVYFNIYQIINTQGRKRVSKPLLLIWFNCLSYSSHWEERCLWLPTYFGVDLVMEVLFETAIIVVQRIIISLLSWGCSLHVTIIFVWAVAVWATIAHLLLISVLSRPGWVFLLLWFVVGLGPPNIIV